VLRVYRTPFSTNVERVALALGHKGVAVEWIDVDPADRAEVVRVSGQALVPVLDDDGAIVTDSPRILRHLEHRFPEPPLLPRAPAARAEVLVFVDWFNRVWKVPPNEIQAERERPAPDPARIAALGAELAGSRELFEDLLDGRDFLWGDFTLADVTAFPFLKYALLWDDADDDPFHDVLREHLSLDGRYPRLDRWIRRVDALPRG
jgi:glutathione S-transferase